jgi:hypothetical protein
MASTPLPPQQLAPDLTEYAGLWVAIRDGRVVEAHRTPDELVAALHRRDITDATVMRLPGEYDKELVGLG